MANPTYSTYSWKDIVESVDTKDREFEKLHPIVYRFSGPKGNKRDSGVGPYGTSGG